MKKLMRRLSKVSDSSHYTLLSSESKPPRRNKYSFRNGAVPAGHIPVYVGDEMEKFFVSAELLNHPIFVTLLDKSAQEYGYEQKGVLRIPCHVILFERVLEALRIDGEARDVHELLNMLSEECC